MSSLCSVRVSTRRPARSGIVQPSFSASDRLEATYGTQGCVLYSSPSFFMADSWGGFSPSSEAVTPTTHAPNSSSSSNQGPYSLASEVGKNNVGARAFDAGKSFHHDARLVDPAILRGRFDHRVLA